MKSSGSRLTRSSRKRMVCSSTAVSGGNNSAAGSGARGFPLDVALPLPQPAKASTRSERLASSASLSIVIGIGLLFLILLAHAPGAVSDDQRRKPGRIGKLVPGVVVNHAR